MKLLCHALSWRHDKFCEIVRRVLYGVQMAKLIAHFYRSQCKCWRNVATERDNRVHIEQGLRADAQTPLISTKKCVVVDGCCCSSFFHRTKATKWGRSRFARPEEGGFVSRFVRGGGPFRKGLFKRVVRFRFVFVVWKICYGNRKVAAYENRIENKPTTKKI